MIWVIHHQDEILYRSTCPVPVMQKALVLRGLTTAENSTKYHIEGVNLRRLN